MIDSNDTWILRCYIFENCCQYQMRYVSAKGLTSSNPGFFRFLSGLQMATKAKKKLNSQKFLLMLGEEKNVSGMYLYIITKRKKVSTPV